MSGSKTQATPGPWTLEVGQKRAVDAKVFFPGDHGGRVLALVMPDRLAGSNDQALAVRDANARLIAAAPQMRKALKKALKHLDGSECDCVAVVRAALRAADGEES